MAGTIATTALTDNGTIITTSEPFDLTTSPLLTEITNNASGTTLAKLAALTGAPSTVITAVTATKAVVGPVVGGAGTSGSAQIAIQGRASCVFDGATTAGDYVQISGTVAGDCSDVGSTYPTSGQVIGRVLSTNGGAGTYAILVFAPEIDASSGGGGGVSSVTITAGTGVNLSGPCNSTFSISCTINTPWSYSGSNIFTNNAGTTTVTNGAIFSSTVTAASLSTVGTVAGAVCSTSAGLILYEVGTSCYDLTGHVAIATPEQYGAVGDGSNNDAPAIRSAMSALNGFGGGTLLLGCNAVYALNSAPVANNSLLTLYSNVNIEGCGNSSVLKAVYAGGANSFYYVLAPVNNTTNIYYSRYSNFKIDVNKNLDILQIAGGVALSINCGGYIIVDGVSVYNNPGANDIVLGGSSNNGSCNGTNGPSTTLVDAKVINSSFNTACDAIASSTCIDHSDVYMYVTNGVIANNIFSYGGPASGNAIEVHGNDISVTGNSVLTYFSCFIPAANDQPAAHNGVSQNITFTGNNCFNVSRGVNMFTDSSGAWINLIISDNTFFQVASASVPVIDMNTNVGSNQNYAIKIANNTIWGSGNNTSGISLGPMFNAMISGNIIADLTNGINKVGNSVGVSLIVGNQFNSLSGTDIVGVGTGWSTGCFSSPTSYYNGYGLC